VTIAIINIKPLSPRRARASRLSLGIPAHLPYAALAELARDQIVAQHLADHEECLHVDSQRNALKLFKKLGLL